MTLKTFALIMLAIPGISVCWATAIWAIWFLYYSAKEEYYDEQIAAQQFRLNQLKLEGENHEKTT